MSSFKLCYIQNCAITNHVIKRLLSIWISFTVKISIEDHTSHGVAQILEIFSINLMSHPFISADIDPLYDMFADLTLIFIPCHIWFHIGCPCVCLSICPSVLQSSVHPFVRISFLDDNLSKHQWIFTKLGMCIDIVEIWFEIADGQILSNFDGVICPIYTQF